MTTIPTPATYEFMQPSQFQTLVQALDHAAKSTSGMGFYSPRGELVEELSYYELARSARVTGAALLATGLEAGDRVGLVAETEADFVRAFVGCLCARLVPCPLPLPIAFGALDAYRQQLERILSVADTSVVIVPDVYHELISAHLSERKLDFIGSLAMLNKGDVSTLPEGDPDPEELAYLQFSSGTTHAPKGIAISHRALMANVDGMVSHALRIGPEDKGVSWLPFYHDMGLVGCMILPIAAQMQMDYLATRDFVRRPGLWTKMISRSKATISFSPSFGYELAARRSRPTDDLDLSSWRIAGIGGDMIKSANLKEFASQHACHGFREASFVPSYGMAEVSLALTFAPLETKFDVQRLDLDDLGDRKAVIATDDNDNARNFVLCGSLLPGHDVEIRDEDGSVLADYQIGTVFTRGPSVMIGYFHDEQATRAVLDDDGWLDTGDLGYLTDGQLVLTGRAKDLIIINGRNIWPQDIEWSLENAVKDAREGRVVAFGNGQSANDEEETVTVVAECRLSDPDRRAALRKQIDDHVQAACGVKAHIAFSKPGLLPRTSSGKLSRSKARLMYFDGIFDE